MVKEVTIREIEAIFAVTDPMGLSRELLVIPLMPRHPGRVRRLVLVSAAVGQDAI